MVMNAEAAMRPGEYDSVIVDANGNIHIIENNNQIDNQRRLVQQYRDDNAKAFFKQALKQWRKSFGEYLSNKRDDADDNYQEK